MNSRRQAGFSLLELLFASFLGLIALTGILYLYKGQHKNMLMQSGASEMRMNGQFALGEAQHYLAHIGLGLPANTRNLTVSNGDLVIRMNPTKKSSPAAMDASSNTSETSYRIPRGDTALFANKAYAAALVGSSVVEAPIKAVVPCPGVPALALVTLVGSKTGFSVATTLYPLERVRLHRCTGVGTDTAEGEFRILQDDPGIRIGIKRDTLTLAEGIESLDYRYFMRSHAASNALPVSLDSLAQVEVIVVAKSAIADRSAAGDGHKRDTLTAKVSYRRSL